MHGFSGSQCFHFGSKSLLASAGNRTRAARVAGEHSTTEPPMLTGLVAKANLKTFSDG